MFVEWRALKFSQVRELRYEVLLRPLVTVGNWHKKKLQDFVHFMLLVLCLSFKSSNFILFVLRRCQSVLSLLRFVVFFTDDALNKIKKW